MGMILRLTKKLILQTYRANRIPVKDNIRNTVFNLITEENDIENKKRHPAKWYRAETATRLKLDENGNPSLRSYEDLVNEIRKYLRVRNPLDDPWSFGSLINYPIPQDKIIEVWRLCNNLRTGGPVIELPDAENGTISVQYYKDFAENKLKVMKWLTIRQVRWYIMLRSIPTGLEDDPEAHPVINTTEIHIRMALNLALKYAIVEQRAELLKKGFITTGLDSDTLDKINDNFVPLMYQIWRNDELIKHQKLH